MTLTIDQLARSLVSVGYEQEEIRATLVERFPDADVDQALDEAYRWHNRIELDLAEAQERDERAPREAEHNLNPKEDQQ